MNQRGQSIQGRKKAERKKQTTRGVPINKSGNDAENVNVFMQAQAGG